MIAVHICKSGDHYTGFSVSGHAGYAEKGKDIVCAAVSALTITLEKTLGTITNTFTYAYLDEPSDVNRTLISHPDESSDILMKAYQMGIEGIEEEYPEYVKLHLEN